MDRGPRVYDKVILYGERMMILDVSDGKIRTHDDTDLRIERRVDSLEWDETQGAWREIAMRPAVTDWKIAPDMTVTTRLDYTEDPDAGR